jgi:murein DD-endopeptidase MepM/ murein hydrolase activator NlpD
LFKNPYVVLKYTIKSKYYANANSLVILPEPIAGKNLLTINMFNRFQQTSGTRADIVVEQAAQSFFRKSADPHILILAKGDSIRHMTIRPWMSIVALGLLTFFSLGYLLSTSYLVLRDDLIGVSVARQAHMQQDYEDRIAALRAQVDRITSRQLLDQQVVEQKVERLLQQQMALSSRHGKLDTLLERAENSGVVPVEPTAYAPANPGDHAALSSGQSAIANMLALQKSVPSTQFSQVALRESVGDRADKLFTTVTKSLKTIENEQLSRIQNLTIGASQTADAIQSILTKTGVETASVQAEPAEDESAVGGPYLPPQATDRFESSLSDLDTALNRLEKVRAQARKLPFANPAPGMDITSTFGNRSDPFFGTLAFHAGIDFREKFGAAVTSTGAGVVTNAGPSGGYGNMVEIDHGNGISTRYGHLSRILAKVGDTVKTGDKIGEAGSTGRSTGTHLHYEVRRNDIAVDPMRFLNAGMKLTTYLE